MKQNLHDAWYLMRQNPVTLLSGAGVLLLLVVAVFGPWLAPYDPLMTNAAKSLQAPSMAHWFGTDQLGRDVLSRVIAATRLDIAISVSAVLMSAVVGVFIGAVAGYAGGWFDRIIGRCTDVLMAFPLFVLAMGLVAALGNSVQNVVLATAIVNVPFYLRLMRAEVNVRRDAGFIEAARISGNGHVSLLVRQLIPNCMPPITIQMSLNLGWAILNAAGLSYIGLGVQAPTPEWGIMVADGSSSMMSGEWWVVVYPGLALMFSVFCFNLLGDGLRDMLDPKRRT